MLSPYFLVPSLFFPSSTGWDRQGGGARHRVQTMSHTQYKLQDEVKESSHRSAGQNTLIRHLPGVRPCATAGRKMCTHFLWKGCRGSLETSAHEVQLSSIGSVPRRDWLNSGNLGGAAEPGPAQHLSLAPFRLWLSPRTFSSSKISSREDGSLGWAFLKSLSVLLS